MLAHNPSAHLIYRTLVNNGLTSVGEGSTPSPIGLSSISAMNDSTGTSFSLPKSSRTSDGLISGLIFNHNEVLREGGFMSYGSSPAENATSTPNSFTTSSLDGYLTGGQGGPASNHSFDLLDSDSFTEMPNTLSPSCQSTYEDNSGQSYVDKQKQVAVDRTSGAPIRKKRKNGPPVRPSCPDCGKEFSNQSALSKHKLTHSDERKFVCNQCAKAFKRQDHLNGHLLTHRSKKPYECDVEGCEKTYCDARSLRRHKENHHPAGQTSGQNQSLQTLAFIPGIALNFSTANLGLTQSQSLNRIQYAPPPPPPPSVATPLVPPVTVSAEQSAATHLQRLALHKHDNNIHNTNDNKWAQVSREGTATQKWSQNTSVINKNSFINNNNETEKHSIKSEIYNKLEMMANSNSNLLNETQENALLHQLLTQEQFKEKPHLYQLSQELSQQHHHISQQPRQHSDDHQRHPQQQPSLPQLHIQHNHQSSQNSMPSEPQHSLQNMPPLQSAPQPMTTATDNWPYDMFAQHNKSEPPHVECPLCKRKFKNVPALNGHMRLHGGYLKNQTQTNNTINNMNNIKKDITKADPSQVNANVKAILNLIKEKISQKHQNSNLTNLGLSAQSHPPSHPHQVSHLSTSQPQHIGPQQVLAPMLSPVTPVTPTTTSNTTTFNYDFSQPVNNQLQFTREDNELYYENELLLLREQLQQSQQFRMPSQPSSVVNRFQAQERRQQQSRRHSDSSDMSINSVENNAPKTTTNESFQPMDSYSNQQINDLLRRRTQRTCSDPGDQPLMTINTNYQSPQHQYHQYYHQSHSVPTTPTLCHNSSLQPHSLPSTPTTNAAPLTFVHSPHQKGSVPNTPTDANQHFNFIPVPSPINQGSVHSQHSQHSQYSASPASVAQYSPNTPYSPTVPQFTYSVPQQQSQQQTVTAPQQQTIHQNVYSEQQMYASISDYTNTEQNIPEDHFNFNANMNGNNGYFASQNDMLTHNESNIPIDSQSIEQMSIQSIPQTSKQFFGNFSTPNTSHEYNTIATTSNYVQSSNYWTQSSLTNSVQMNQIEAQPQSSQVVPNSQPNSTTTIVSHSSYAYSVPSVTTTAHTSGVASSTPVFNTYMNAPEHHHQSHVRSASIHRRSTSSPPHLVVNLEKIDECDEETDDVFLSPVGVAPSPKRTSPAIPVISKRPKHRPEPLYIPPHVNTCGYQSRLRSPRLWDPSAVVITKNLSPPPYTPPPMLSPVRSGPGLFWHIISGSMTPKSGTIAPKFVYSRKSSIEMKEKEEPSAHPSVAQTPTTAYEPFDCEIPETDIQPHVNIGPNFQARIPAFNKNKDEAKYRQEKADLLWDPSVAESLTDADIESYLELSCCACVPGSGRNKEYAMHLLNISKGNIHEAIVKLLEPHPTINEGHPLANYHYPENDIWVPQEIESYQNALNKCDKDFFSIAREVGTKSVKQCIQFYYMWKKVCPDEYRRLRVIRRKREHETIFYNLRSKEAEENNNNINGKLDLEIDNNTESELNGLANSCQSSDIDDNASSLLDSTNPSPATSVSSQAAAPVGECSYPCKLCGKVFQKVKSRSAHMKIHGSGSAKY